MEEECNRIEKLLDAKICKEKRVKKIYLSEILNLQHYKHLVLCIVDVTCEVQIFKTREFLAKEFNDSIGVLNFKYVPSSMIMYPRGKFPDNYIFVEFKCNSPYPVDKNELEGFISENCVRCPAFCKIEINTCEFTMNRIDKVIQKLL